MAATVLLERGTDRLSAADLPLIERLLRESQTWALVDGLSSDAVSRLVARDPDEMTPTLDRWATDADFWVRRASLLAELRPIRKGQPLDRFLARAEPMLEEREFFIRKAIGWVLREAGKRRPDDVAAWLAPRTGPRERSHDAGGREVPARGRRIDVDGRLSRKAAGRLKYRGVPRFRARCVRAPTSLRGTVVLPGGRPIH